MSSVNVLDVQILNGELLPFSSTFRFQITFECVAEIPDDLVSWRSARTPASFTPPSSSRLLLLLSLPVPPLQDWRVVYVGSAKAKAFDQVLDSVLVGPVKCGVSRFELEVPGPKYAEIPPDDLLGSTAVMLSCFYREKEFVRVGYWVSNVYNKALAEGEEPPKAPPQEDISRSVLKEKPCVTRWPIEWT